MIFEQDDQGKDGFNPFSCENETNWGFPYSENAQNKSDYEIPEEVYQQKGIELAEEEEENNDRESTTDKEQIVQDIKLWCKNYDFSLLTKSEAIKWKRIISKYRIQKKRQNEKPIPEDPQLCKKREQQHKNRISSEISRIKMKELIMENEQKNKIIAYLVDYVVKNTCTQCSESIEKDPKIKEILESCSVNNQCKGKDKKKSFCARSVLTEKRSQLENVRHKNSVKNSLKYSSFAAAVFGIFCLMSVFVGNNVSQKQNSNRSMIENNSTNLSDYDSSSHQDEQPYRNGFNLDLKQDFEELKVPNCEETSTTSSRIIEHTADNSNFTFHLSEAGYDGKKDKIFNIIHDPLLQNKKPNIFNFEKDYTIRNFKSVECDESSVEIKAINCFNINEKVKIFDIQKIRK